jgi:adenylate cyclase
MGEDEAGTVSALKTYLSELITPKIVEQSGRIVKTTGDGFLAEFASVVAAVQCATEIQGAMSTRGAGRPEPKRLQFRIGINLGDILAEGDDVFGDGVNVAARLEASHSHRSKFLTRLFATSFRLFRGLV